jgi:hypothetical protein
MKGRVDMRIVIVGLALVLVPVLAGAQTKNPTRAIFNPGPDNGIAVGYEIELFTVQGASIQRFTFPPQTPDVAGDVTVSLNVQPIAFGTYYGVARLLLPGGLKSPDSSPSDPFVREAGPPSKPRFTYVDPTRSPPVIWAGVATAASLQ